MFGIGAQELLLILLIALFFFGGERLPDIAKGLGQGLREFQRATEGKTDNEDEPTEHTKSPEQQWKNSACGAVVDFSKARKH
jgi:sec-independent protein translocase protein TatA